MTDYPLCYREYAYLYKTPKHKYRKQNNCFWEQFWKRRKEGEKE